MAGYSITMRDAILNEVFRGIAATWPSTFYIALLTTNPSDDTGTGLVEVSTANWTNYARVGIARGTPGWAAPAGGTTSPQSTSNVNVVNFGTAATGANVTISGWAIYDAATAGVLWGWNTFGATPPIVQNGNPVDFPVNQFIVNQ